jgi:hypothetical protein
VQYVAQVNAKIASADSSATPSIKYHAAATLLVVSQTLRLSSAQSDALYAPLPLSLSVSPLIVVCRTIGLKALGVFLQVPQASPITDTQVCYCKEK